MAVKVDHKDVMEHHSNIMQRYREIWMEGQLCDVVIRSNDGQQHRAHGGVLSAASQVLKKLLIGSFMEADQVKHGQPIEIAASGNVVSALLDYIYGGQPELTVEDSIELLRLADAYDLPDLTFSIEGGLGACVIRKEVDTALKVLQQPHGLRSLKMSCEMIVANHFDRCAQCPDFLKLTASQLGRILERKDLRVKCEEDVLQAVLKWFNGSKEKSIDIFGLLLRQVDFQAISLGNLARIGQLSPTFGPPGDELQREVDEATHKKRHVCESDIFVPKRRCLRHFSQELGATSFRQVCNQPCRSLCWREGTMYMTGHKTIFAWKPGGEASPVAGRGAGVNGINNLMKDCGVAALPAGELLVADCGHDRLVSFQNGTGTLVLDEVAGLTNVFCSPKGVIYVLRDDGKAIDRLVGTSLQPQILSANLPDHLQFETSYLFVTEEEMLYLSDYKNARILCFKPGEKLPVIVGEVPNKEDSALCGLFVTQDRRVYVADSGIGKVWAFPSGDGACVEVVESPDDIEPYTVLARDQSLYVGMDGFDEDALGLYEYPMPADFKLET